MNEFNEASARTGFDPATASGRDLIFGLPETQDAVVIVADAKCIAGTCKLDDAEQFITGFQLDAANALASIAEYRDILNGEVTKPTNATRWS